MKIFILFLFLMIMTPANAKTLIIGDSIFALTRDVPNNLRDAGYDFEMRAQVGAKIEQIAKQYIMYKEENGVPSLIIMDGGGNDILRGALLDCLRGTPKCYEIIDEIYTMKRQITNEMKADGVEKILYVGIHYLHGWRSPLNIPIDYAMDRFKINDITTLIDIREPFKEEGLLLVDGIHPNAKGSKIISDLLLLELQMLQSPWR